MPRNTTPRKNITGDVIRCEWVPGGYVDADATVDTPDRQPDQQRVEVDEDGNQTIVTVPGDPLIWHSDIWEPGNEPESRVDAALAGVGGQIGGEFGAAITPSDGPSAADVRLWAAGQGIEVAASGPIPADVLEQYNAAKAV